MLLFFLYWALSGLSGVLNNLRGSINAASLFFQTMRQRIQNLLKLVPLEILVTAIAFLLSLFTFSFIAHEAVSEKEDAFDNNVIHFFAAHSSPSFIKAMEWITFLGSSTFLLPAYVVLIIVLIRKKNYAYAIDTAIIAISSTAMMFAIKQFFHRQRPELPVIKGVSGYSFPSGHSLSSFIFCAILIYFVHNNILPTARKKLVIFFLVLCPLIIGLSRVALNVHYATDVIGGFCFAAMWVILAFMILKKIRKKISYDNTAPLS